MIPNLEQYFFPKLNQKTKLSKQVPKKHFNTLHFINSKNAKQSNLESESVKKNVISLDKKKSEILSQNTLKENNANKMDDMDVEMKIEEVNFNESLKNSISCEKMNISNEDEFKKNKTSNSYNNTDYSSGDSYSTANSNHENHKKKIKQKLSKLRIEFSILGKKRENNEIQISNESENVKNFIAKNEEEYIEEILENLIEEEKNINNAVNPNYFELQKEINPKMRSILIDWLIDVHNIFNFKQETLYTAIYIMDSFLSIKLIQRKRFQLLGITSLLISTKFNEIYLRKMRDYALVTDNAYTIDDIKKMEQEIVKTLNFNFLVPSALSFFGIITKKIGISEDINIYKFGEFLMESFLIDFKSLYFSYSTIAWDSCYIAMKFYKMKNYQICYNNKLFSVKNNVCNNDLYAIKKCAKNIWGVISEIINSNFQSLFNKYSKYSFYDDFRKILGSSKK